MSNMGGNVEKMKRLSILCIVLIGFLSCNHDSQEKLLGMVKIKTLPVGWKLYTGTMPVSDKMPWWTANPLILGGKQVKQIPFFTQPTKASSACGALYTKNGESELMILCLHYDNRNEFLVEYKRFQQEVQSTESLIGIAKKIPNTIVIMVFGLGKDDQLSFNNYFKSLTNK